MIYQMDTDHTSVLQRRTAGFEQLEARLRQVAPDDYGTTVVTYEEQCRGWLEKINRSKTSRERVVAYADLRGNLSFFSRIAVWEYTDAAESFYAALVKSKIRVGTKDLRIASIALANNATTVSLRGWIPFHLRIASIALANNATVLTRNTRDFACVPGLLYADWTV